MNAIMMKLTTEEMKEDANPDTSWSEYVAPPVRLLFTPCPVTRFAMHRIYANRTNSRCMSRDFGIFMPKRLAG